MLSIWGPLTVPTNAPPLPFGTKIMQSTPSEPEATDVTQRDGPSSWPMAAALLSELRSHGRITLPLTATNLTWFAKTTITTASLGRLGELQLAGGALGFTFANVTGFSVLAGLCAAMEPICGQAHGAQNRKLLHRTLLMAILMLLAASVPITILWLSVDKVLVRFGQQRDITDVAKRYIRCLIPDLVVNSFLFPLKAYLSSQGVTLPTMFSSAMGLAFHVPLNYVLARTKGLEGVSMGIWLTDLAVVIMLATYVLVAEKWKGGGWWEHRAEDWIQLLRLAAPCCLTTCLEWWCYEILVLLSGNLPDARKAVASIVIVLNFDCLLYSLMLSLATTASARVSNELGAGQPLPARNSGYVSLGLSSLGGLFAGSAMILARGKWGSLFSHDKRVVDMVKVSMMLMGVVEVVNFPLTVMGGIVRGTARPWLGMYASLGGFYLAALPVAVALSFKVGLGIGGLLLGFLVGVVASASMMAVFVACINWAEEAEKAQMLVGLRSEDEEEE